METCPGVTKGGRPTNSDLRPPHKSGLYLLFIPRILPLSRACASGQLRWPGYIISRYKVAKLPQLRISPSRILVLYKQCWSKKLSPTGHVPPVVTQLLAYQHAIISGQQV